MSTTGGREMNQKGSRCEGIGRNRQPVVIEVDWCRFKLTGDYERKETWGKRQLRLDYLCARVLNRLDPTLVLRSS